MVGSLFLVELKIARGGVSWEKSANIAVLSTLGRWHAARVAPHQTSKIIFLHKESCGSPHIDSKECELWIQKSAQSLSS